MLQRMPQQIAQPDQHADRSLVLVITHKPDDAVERVEEKVRMQLHAQRVELRLGQLRFEPRGEYFALAIFAIVVKRITDPDHRAVNQQIGTKSTWHARKKTRQELLRTLGQTVERIDL